LLILLILSLIKEKLEMNGDRLLIDTNIIIYSAQDGLNINDFVKDDDDLYISTITYIEALGFPFQNRDEERRITTFCNTFQRLFLTKEIEKQTIIIRKSFKIKLPDAIIAATAIVYDLTLVTCDSNDFKNISNLNILNPVGFS